ncbi:uncharacterized protein [Callorhinus ursinus]|uniref:uncharacterized protein n=1 Tax=Callorhinus ursinus TaxID=34884 RepID=UPI003CD02A83
MAGITGQCSRSYRRYQLSLAQGVRVPYRVCAGSWISSVKAPKRPARRLPLFSPLSLVRPSTCDARGDCGRGLRPSPSGRRLSAGPPQGRPTARARGSSRPQDPVLAWRSTATQTPGGASGPAFRPRAGLPAARSRPAGEPPNFPARRAARGAPFHPPPLPAKAVRPPPGAHRGPGACPRHCTEFSQNRQWEAGGASFSVRCPRLHRE